MTICPAPAPVAPVTTWGTPLTLEERKMVRYRTSMVPRLFFSNVQTRRKRFIPVFFRLEIGGVDFQLLLRFRDGIRPHSLPKGFTVTTQAFDVVLYRKWKLFRRDRDYVEADYPFFIHDELKSLIVRIWRGYDYIDYCGQLVESEKYAHLPPGSTVLSRRVALERLKRVRKVA